MVPRWILEGRRCHVTLFQLHDLFVCLYVYVVFGVYVVVVNLKTSKRTMQLFPPIPNHQSSFNPVLIFAYLINDLIPPSPLPLPLPRVHTILERSIVNRLLHQIHKAHEKIDYIEMVHDVHLVILQRTSITKEFTMKTDQSINFAGTKLYLCMKLCVRKMEHFEYSVPM